MPFLCFFLSSLYNKHIQSPMQFFLSCFTRPQTQQNHNNPCYFLVACYGVALVIIVVAYVVVLVIIQWYLVMRLSQLLQQQLVMWLSQLLQQKLFIWLSQLLQWKLFMCLSWLLQWQLNMWLAKFMKDATHLRFMQNSWGKNICSNQLG